MKGAVLPAEIRQRRQLPGAGFVLLALALQTSLLLLPWKERTPAPAWSPTLELRLRQEPTPERPQTLPPTRSRIQPAPQLAAPVARPSAPATPSDAPDRPDNTSASSPKESPAVTVRRLRETLEDMDWTFSGPSPGDEEVIPGRSLEGDLDDGWRRPVLALETGPLGDAYLTGDTEIVDRWQEPGGAHRVVVRTPDGQTLCGRQEPVNDFRPWEQMPMLFHRCAGGGRR
jgi:hypothetical protein